MEFRGADALSSESLSGKKVSYGDSVYKYENSNTFERIVMKPDISHDDLHAFFFLLILTHLVEPIYFS
jgi:hypothetical protein